MCCNATIEWTCEFLYKDICDFATRTERKIIDVCGGKTEYCEITFNIVATNSQMAIVMNANEKEAEKIKDICAKIREAKKTGNLFIEPAPMSKPVTQSAPTEDKKVEVTDK